MTWVAISDHDGHVFCPKGLGAPNTAPEAFQTGDSALMTRGSLVIETRLPVTSRPRHLLYFDLPGTWPMHLSLQVIPGAGLILILDQGGEVLHRTIDHSDAGRADVLRIVYSWDSPRRWGRLSLERSDQQNAFVVPICSPKPFLAGGLLALMQGTPDRYLAPEISYLALSTKVEPVGPMPTLVPETPIATPYGFRMIRDLKRGDLIVTPDGYTVPVLHVVSRTVPAKGRFRPMLIRAPYFGLHKDLHVAPNQRLILSGTEVEYLFGSEFVLCPVSHFSGTSIVAPTRPRSLATYMQVVLPENEVMNAAGMMVESLHLGRIRRKPDLLSASVFANTDRQLLPDHGQPAFPVLKALDALILAEHRAA